MNAILIPGQGHKPSDFLDTSHDIKRKWYLLVEEITGFKINSDTCLRHDVNSGLIVANAIANFEIFLENKGHCGGVAGYSVGQYAALGIAEILPFQSCVLLAIQRAQLMQKYCRPHYGMMAILGMPEKDLKDCITTVLAQKNENKDFLSISNYNSSFNITVAGELNLLNLLQEIVVSRGAKKTDLLKVEGAWHSPMLEPAVPELESVLNVLNFSSPKISYIDNFTGKKESCPQTIKQNLLKHLTHPVQWVQTVQSLVQDGYKNFFECGAGNQLSKMIFFIDRKVMCHSMHNLGDIKKCAAL